MSSGDHHLQIDVDVAREAGVPDDLDATQRDPYTIPSTFRRRTAGWIYVAAAVLTFAAALSGLSSWLVILGGLFGLIAVWHFVSAWPIQVLDPEALDAANRTTEFAVGHASAAVGFDTWRARPVWNVLVFSADEPPSHRGLVRVDAVDGHVIESYSEAIDTS